MKTSVRLFTAMLVFGVLGALRAQTTSASATPAAPPVAPVPPPEAHQFDFWLGDWEVFGPKGRMIAHSKIESVSGGFALLENWNVAPALGGSSGKSLNSYNPVTKQWQQYWVGSGGLTTEYKGGLVDGKMVLVAEQTRLNAPTTHTRATWTPNADGSVTQQFESSSDGGKTWQPGFVGLYKRHVGTP